MSTKEAEVIQGLASITKSVPYSLLDETMQWEEEEGLLYHKGKLYIPNNQALRQEIVKECHNFVRTGHPRKHDTLELVMCHY